MRRAIARFNETAGGEMIALKMGAHAGACLAVTLNGQLDYFGQAVNLAARIQGVASSNEICISDDLYRMPGAAALLAGCQLTETQMRVKGIDREVIVLRIGSHEQCGPYPARSVSPGATRVKRTGTASAASRPSRCWTRTNVDVARSPSPGKSVR